MRQTARFVAIVILLATGHARAEDPSADEQAIRKIDAEMVAALNAHDVDKWLGYFASDARMLPPGATAVVGKDAIRKMIEEFLATPGFLVRHHLESVVVAKSGDLAYDSYSYELTVRDSTGKPMTEKGKDVSLFRKQFDGSWKLIIDMWSENRPPAGGSS